MLKNKLFNITLIIFIGMTLLAGIAFTLWKTTFATSQEETELITEKPLTADEIVAQTVTTDLITTNLLTNDYIVIQFGILLDNKKAKEEFEKRTVEVKSIIITELSGLKPEELKGPEGINKLEAMLMSRFNDILLDGKVKKVYTIDRKLQ